MHVGLRGEPDRRRGFSEATETARGKSHDFMALLVTVRLCVAGLDRLCGGSGKDVLAS